MRLLLRRPGAGHPIRIGYAVGAMPHARPDAAAPVRMLVGLLPLLTAVAVLAYATAVIVALPLNLLGVMRVEYCVIPLGVGGVTLPLVLIGELNAV
jgi:hypothetical protein